MRLCLHLSRTHCACVPLCMIRINKDINVTSYPLFQDSKILKSNDIVKVKDVIFVHDFVNKSLPK